MTFDFDPSPKYLGRSGLCFKATNRAATIHMHQFIQFHYRLIQLSLIIEILSLLSLRLEDHQLSYLYL